MISTIIFGLTDNGCDCNKAMDYDRARQMEKEDGEYPCGDSWIVKRIILVTPSGEEREIYTD